MHKPSSFARQLRHNMTEAERRLWHRIRLKQLDGARFRRQAPMGRYVVDFVCHDAKLIVELDGGQHADRIGQDADRTAWLEAEGYRVLRFWNNEVFENLEGVLAAVSAVLSAAAPHPSPPHKGGGRRSRANPPASTAPPSAPPAARWRACGWG
jgi:very-short-patch-repair endonuclease